MRVLKKEVWPHKVSIGIIEPPDTNNIENWLFEHYGRRKSRWNAVYRLGHTDYYFKNAKDSILFALRWS